MLCRYFSLLPSGAMNDSSTHITYLAQELIKTAVVITPQHIQKNDGLKYSTHQAKVRILLGGEKFLNSQVQFLISRLCR